MNPKYAFRVKPTCELARLLEYLTEAETHNTQEDAVAAGFSWATVYTAWGLNKAADNFSFTPDGAVYTDVVPQTIIHKADRVEATAIASPQQDSPQQDGPTIRWPEAPFAGEPLECFVKPPFYDRMAAMVKCSRHISLAGPPGIGKSTAVEQLAIEHGKPLVNISADAGLRRRDLTGNVELINAHTQFMVAEYVAAAVNGWWVKIDEVNAAEPDALMFLNSQLAPPFAVNFYGSSMPVHPDFRLFVTYNPGLIGTKPLPPAFKDRFFPVKLQFPTEFQLRRLLEANGMPQRDGNDNHWTDAIVQFGLRAWAQHEKGRCRYQITPRRLMDAIVLVDSGLSVCDALEAAAVDAVDNMAEAKVLKEVLRKLKQEAKFGRI